LPTESRRLDPQLQVGDAATKIEVVADVAQLQVDNGAKQKAVAPTVINQLPLLVFAGTPRNAVQFISLLPGVNTGTSPQAKSETITNGVIIRTAFPGNQIPASQQSALALKWMSFLRQLLLQGRTTTSWRRRFLMAFCRT